MSPGSHGGGTYGAFQRGGGGSVVPISDGVPSYVPPVT